MKACGILNGPILGPAHPVYDHFAGQPAPTKGRNPVGYFKSEFDLRPCLCRCGGISYNNFLPGHDQRAIHERIGKIGTVKDFLTWFDEHWTSK